jgi:hypothetical protein
MPLSQPAKVTVDIDKIVVNSPSVTDEFDDLSTQIGDLETTVEQALEGKAPVSHGHEISHILGLNDVIDSLQTADGLIQDELAQKAPADHTHSLGELGGTEGDLASDLQNLQLGITQLQTAIDDISLTPGLHYPIVSATPPNNPPQAGWQWTQLDGNGRSIDWVWDGARWLSRQSFQFGVCVAKDFSITENHVLSGHSGNRLLLLEELIASWHHAENVGPGLASPGVDSTSNFWVARLLLLRGGGQGALSPDRLVSGQGINANANTNIVRRLTLGIEFDCRDSANNNPPDRVRALNVQFARSGTSSFLLRFPTVGVSYRWIYTP